MSTPLVGPILQTDMSDYTPDFADFVSRHARLQPEKTAIIEGSRRYSWADFWLLVRCGAAGLARAGIRRQDRVAIVATAPMEFMATFAAVVSLGGIAVPLAVGIGKEALARMVAHCQAKVVVIGGTVPAVSSADIGFRELVRSRPLAPAANAFDAAASTPVKQSTDILSVSYTSGTTQSPKGIIRTREAQYNSLRILARHNSFASATVYLVATAIYTPMTWGVVMAVLAAGGLCLFPQSTEPSVFLDMSRIHQPTFTQLVPANLALLLADRTRSDSLLPSCQRVVIGGARMDIGLKEKARVMLGVRYSDIYGASESGAISDSRGSDPYPKLMSVGRPLEDARIAILEPGGTRVLPRGDIGEIAVHTSRLMRGYLDEPAEADAVWWLDKASEMRHVRTGDIGWFDTEGYLWIQDRKRDIIISGGFNVFPSDIEAVLAAHPSVLEAAVTGVPHDILGEVPIAFVILRTQGAISATQLRTWANALLDSKRRIHVLEVVDKISRNDSGKVLKHLLQRRS